MNWWVLKKRIHISWLITVLCYSFSIGVYLSKYNNDFSSLFFVLISVLLFIFACYKNRLYVVPLVIFSGLLVGLWRGSTAQIQINTFKKFYGERVSLVGTIKNSSDVNSSGKLSIQLSVEKINDKKVTGDIWSTLYEFDLNRGDMVKISGTLQKGFGNLLGAIYSANLEAVILKNTNNFLSNFRDDFSQSIEDSIGENEAKLGIGFLLGQKKDLPANLVLSLQAVGLTHIVVASGYNLTILVRLARRVFEKISKYLSAVFSVLMIIGFILITGISPSMSRAGFVSLISLLAWYYGRKFHPIILLGLAMSGTLMINPNYIWGDIGWQLSFAAFAGVMILSPLLQKYFFGNKKPSSIRQILGETIAAQIVTAPIIIYSFGQISNVSILANLLVLPFVPLAMLFTFIAGLGGIVAPQVATIIGTPAKILLGYMISIINKLSDIPWAVSEFNLSLFLLAIYYLTLVIICIYLIKITKHKLRDSNLVE